MTDQEEGSRGGTDAQSVVLTAAERDVLVKACQRYRSTIPAYLKSREDERLLLDALIEKLSS